MLRAAAVISGIVLLATGCSSQAGSTATTTDASVGSGKGAVAMSFGGLDIQIWNDMLTFMKPMVETAGYQFLVDDPAWKIQTQVSDWESWVARGDVKAIMGYPVQSDSTVAVTGQADAAGIPVLGYASAWEGTTASVLIDNHADGLRLGTDAGKWIVEKYGSGTPVPVALLGYRDTDLGRERTEGIVEGLQAAGANVSLNESSVISLDDGYAAVQNQLTAQPNTKVWLSMGNDPALGAYQALIDSGVDPHASDVLLGNVDATDDILNIVKDPQSFWRLVYILPARQLGEANAQMLIDAADGKPLKDVTISSTQVTPENAESFLLANQ
ncbi:carbohydrate-binding protein [Subtercola boreus]|uniref:Carbohydrate-binding protein n=1 Tax=Subtercola boreus TaxID=120213 RepID=A0A3E0VB49_9MICO|nr:carbohydrate-binding protein [Subtercola boreus]